MLLASNPIPGLPCRPREASPPDPASNLVAVGSKRGLYGKAEKGARPYASRLGSGKARLRPTPAYRGAGRSDPRDRKRVPDVPGRYKQSWQTDRQLPVPGPDRFG